MMAITEHGTVQRVGRPGHSHARYKDRGDRELVELPKCFSPHDFCILARRTRDGQSFWDVYAQVLRENLCKPDGELYKLVKAGLHTSTGAIITAVMTGLGLPFAAIGIVVPIAAILM